jgi:predicted TIM-barrel fold metal-dependent hydrolase
MIPDMSKEFVDTHFHVFSAGDGHPQARYKPAYDASMDAWKHASQESGVCRGVLVQASFMGTDNTRLLRELASEPERLRGIAVIAPNVDTAQFTQWHAAGVRGIRLNLAGVSHQIPEWRNAEAVWSAISKLGWHLELHTDVGALPRVLQQLPGDIPLVLDHMAKPDRLTDEDPTVQALLQRLRKTSVHIKLSGAYRLAGRSAGQIAKMWLELIGAERLLWGSDWPCTNHEAEANYAKLFKQVEAWVGNEWVEQVLVRNPSALYWVN